MTLLCTRRRRDGTGRRCRRRRRRVQRLFTAHSLAIRYDSNNYNILIITTTVFMMLSSWPKSWREFTRFIWWMQTERQMAINPQTKPIGLGCESAENWQLPSISTIAIVIITQLVSWYSFYCPPEGGRLSRPRHYSRGAQPVPKAICRIGELL